MEKGGVKSLSVTQISETSKLIKEKMDIELREIIYSFELTAEFFISSYTLQKVWRDCFNKVSTYSVKLDLFLQALDVSKQGKGII